MLHFHHCIWTKSLTQKYYSVTLFLLALFTTNINAQQSDFYQNHISRYEQSLDKTAKHSNFSDIGLYTHKKSLNSGFDEYSISKKLLKRILEEKPESMSMTIKGNNLILNTNDILASDYVLTTSDGIVENPTNNIMFYNGVVKGDISSSVILSVLNDELVMVINTQGESYELMLDHKNKLYIGADVKKKGKINKPFECHTSELPSVNNTANKTKSHNKNLTNSNCVEISLELDYDTYIKNGSNTTAAQNWVLGIMNHVITIYQSASVPLKVKDVFVWTTTDPYASKSDVSQMLDVYVNGNAKTISGTLGHLISTRPLGGGIAYIDVLCHKSNPNTNGYNSGVSSGYSITYASLPTYSWNVNVLSHELGHNFGSSHTHDCVWNGDNTQIDDCGSIAGDPQLCYNSTSPKIPPSGDIMSYCHAVSGSSITLVNGFKEQQVRDLIYNTYKYAPCVTGNCPTTPCTISSTDITHTDNATISTSSLFQTTGSINSNRIISGTGTDVSYKATNGVYLDKEFTVSLGSIFLANTTPCQ